MHFSFLSLLCPPAFAPFPDNRKSDDDDDGNKEDDDDDNDDNKCDDIYDEYDVQRWMNEYQNTIILSNVICHVEDHADIFQ